MAKSDLVQCEIRDVFDYVETTLSVMENCTSFEESIPEYYLLSHIQKELQSIYDTLGYVLTKR